MAIPDIAGLTLEELEELQKEAGRERGKRQHHAQISEALKDIALQAKNAGYQKQAVLQTITRLLDEVYGKEG